MTDIHFDIITCIYCGEPGRDRHHYKESVANSGQKRRYKRGETLPACREFVYWSTRYTIGLI